MAMDPVVRKSLLAMAHFFNVVVWILVLIWMLAPSNENVGLGGACWCDGEKQHNWHPIFTVLGFVGCNTMGMLAFRSFPFPKATCKRLHLMFQGMALFFCGVGLVAIFKWASQHNSRPRFEDGIGEDHMYSVHAWLGLLTYSMYAVQYFSGIFAFQFPKLRPAQRSWFLPNHVCMGGFLYFLSIVVCIIGTMERITILQIQGEPYSGTVTYWGPQSLTANISGLVLIALGLIMMIIFYESKEDVALQARDFLKQKRMKADEEAGHFIPKTASYNSFGASSRSSSATSRENLSDVAGGTKPVIV